MYNIAENKNAHYLCFYFVNVLLWSVQLPNFGILGSGLIVIISTRVRLVYDDTLVR